MPVRRFPVRPNRAMPESPRIVEAVQAAVRRMREGDWGEVAIPWRDFVFSNVALPKSSLVRQGLEIIQRDGPPTAWSGRAHSEDKYAEPKVTREGLHLTIRIMRWAEAQRYRATAFLDHSTLSLWLPPQNADDSIRHELIHLTQLVGENLIRLARGEEAFTERANDIAGARRSRAMKLTGRAKDEAYWSYRYGGPKREALTLGKGTGEVQTSAQHAELDIEFQTNATSAALDAIRNLRERRVDWSGLTPTQLFTTVAHFAQHYVATFKAKRRYGFYVAAYHRAAEEVNKTRKRMALPLLESSLGVTLERRQIDPHDLVVAPLLREAGYRHPGEKRSKEEAEREREGRAKAKAERRLKYHTGKV